MKGMEGYSATNGFSGMICCCFYLKVTKTNEKAIIRRRAVVEILVKYISFF